MPFFYFFAKVNVYHLVYNTFSLCYSFYRKEKDLSAATNYGVWFALYQAEVVIMNMDMIIIMFGVGNVAHC